MSWVNFRNWKMRRLILVWTLTCGVLMFTMLILVMALLVLHLVLMVGILVWCLRSEVVDGVVKEASRKHRGRKI